MDERRGLSAPVAACLSLVLALLLPLIYVGGYFAMGTPNPSLNGAALLREYSAQWQATVFVPAAKLESALRGLEVETDFVQESQPWCPP